MNPSPSVEATMNPVRRPRLRKWFITSVAVYFAVVLLITLFLDQTADVTALGTLLAFAPRWPFALPLFVFIPLACWLRSWWAIGLTLAATVVVAGPLTGGTVSILPLVYDPPEARLRILTCNCGASLLNKQKLAIALNELRPDIACFQETGFTANDKVLPSGWSMVHGPGMVALASRYPMTLAGELRDRNLGVWGGGSIRCKIATPIGPLTVVSMHLPTPRPGIEDVIHNKTAGFPQLRQVIALRDRASQLASKWVGPATGDLFVAGDFNMPGDSVVFRRDWGYFDDAFSRAGNGWGMSKATSYHSIRIDHILSTSSWRCCRVWVGPDVDSDHYPVIADFERMGP